MKQPILFLKKLWLRKECSLHSMKKLLKQQEKWYILPEPYSSYQKGLIEHINGQIRVFYPKGTDFRNVSDNEIAQVENILNNRGRKSLGFRSPNQVRLQ